MRIAVYFLAACLLLGLAWVIFRVFVRRDYRRRGRLTWPSVLLEFLIFALHANFSYLYIPAEWPALPSLPESPLHRTLGLLITAAGLMGTVVGMANLGFRRAFGQEVDEPQQAGLYSITRNPQILMYGLAVIGFVLLWPSWYALGWVLLYAAIAHTMVLTEEEHLRRVGGETYVQYCERVPRYISLSGEKGKAAE
jgi:protein-S-isoprenylcysteine O-methyltransferase Ste14